MRVIKILLIVLGVLVFVGCGVPQKKYDESLAQIDSLKNDVSSLEERLKTKETEKARLEAELARLKEENAKLNNLLNANKDELTRRIRDVENELRSKNAQIAELKAEIAGLSQEKSKAIEEKEKAIAELKKTYDNLVTELNEEIKKGEIAVTQLRDKLSLSMVEKILFDSGSADVKQEGKKVLERVAEILKKVSDKQIRIEGHTDNVPIGPKIAKKFPTNWELSTARATNVVRYLQEKGIDPALLNPTGYAEYKPIESNDTDEGKAKNRRIEIVLIPLDIDRIKQ